MATDPGTGESPQVSTRIVVALVAGIMMILVLIAVGFQPLFRDRIGQSFVLRHGFPEPSVIPNERAERERLEADQRRELDGAHGRIPIDAAMKAVAAKGSHAYDLIGGGQ